MLWPNLFTWGIRAALTLREYPKGPGQIFSQHLQKPRNAQNAYGLPSSESWFASHFRAALVQQSSHGGYLAWCWPQGMLFVFVGVQEGDHPGWVGINHDPIYQGSSSCPWIASSFHVPKQCLAVVEAVCGEVALRYVMMTHLALVFPGQKIRHNSELQRWSAFFTPSGTEWWKPKNKRWELPAKNPQILRKNPQICAKTRKSQKDVEWYFQDMHSTGSPVPFACGQLSIQNDVATNATGTCLKKWLSIMMTEQWKNQWDYAHAFISPMILSKLALRA